MRPSDGPKWCTRGLSRIDKLIRCVYEIKHSGCALVFNLEDHIGFVVYPLLNQVIGFTKTVKPHKTKLKRVTKLELYRQVTTQCKCIIIAERFHVKFLHPIITFVPWCSL